MLAKDISRQPRVDSFIWLLIIAAKQNIMKRSKLGKKNVMFSLRRKGAQRKCLVGAESEGPMLDEQSGDLRAKSYPAQLLVHAKELKESLNNEENHQQQKYVNVTEKVG